MSRGSAGFVSLFAFFLESFAHRMLVGKLESGGLFAAQLAWGGGNACCRGFNWKRYCYQPCD